MENMVKRPRGVALVLLAGTAIACGGAGTSGGDPADAGSDLPVVAPTPGKAEYSFTHAGQTRTFIVYLPKGYAGSIQWPLMVALHGGGGNARQLFQQHPLERYGDERGMVMVTPQGTPEAEGGYEWNGYLAFDTGSDDVGYLARVILGVSAGLKIDPRRRYVAGFSGGATMSVRFGTERSELLTAIGTFAGKVGRSESATPPFVFPPAPSTPLSVQMTYGTLDDNYSGGLKEGILFTSAAEGIAWWVGSMSCGATPTTVGSGQVTFDTYAGCQGGTVVRNVTVDGMDHMWPDAEDGLDGTKLLLDFFADKVKP